MGFPTFARPPCHQGQMAKVPPMGGDVNAGDYPTGTSCHRSTSATCPRPTSHSSMVNRDQTGVRPMYRSVMESQMLPLCDACGTSIDGAAARRVWWNTVFHDADLSPEHSGALVELMDAIAANARRLGAPDTVVCQRRQTDRSRCPDLAPRRCPRPKYVRGPSPKASRSTRRDANPSRCSTAT